VAQHPTSEHGIGHHCHAKFLAGVDLAEALTRTAGTFLRASAGMLPPDGASLATQPRLAARAGEFELSAPWQHNSFDAARSRPGAAVKMRGLLCGSASRASSGRTHSRVNGESPSIL
ncbi:MAG: hypothetical protein WAM44_13830, partial [Chthoniobacterales bacterium]